MDGGNSRANQANLIPTIRGLQALCLREGSRVVRLFPGPIHVILHAHTGANQVALAGLEFAFEQMQDYQP